MPPIAWFATVVHDRKHKDVIRFDGIQDTERKSACQTAPDIAFEFSPPMRSFNNAMNRTFDFDGEAGSKTRLALLVIRNRVKIFAAGFRMKLVAH